MSRPMEYSAGYSLVKRLRKLAATDKARAAIDRLEAFKGTEQDALHCAGLLIAAGDIEAATALVFAPPPGRAA